MISIKLILLLISITPSITFHDACLEAFQNWPEYAISKEAHDYLYDYSFDKELAADLRYDACMYYQEVFQWWYYPSELKRIQRTSSKEEYYEYYLWMLDPDGVPLYRPRQVRKLAWEQFFHSWKTAMSIVIVREVLQDTIFEIPEGKTYQNPMRDQG